MAPRKPRPSGGGAPPTPPRIDWSKDPPKCAACGQRWCMHAITAIGNRTDDAGSTSLGVTVYLPISSFKFKDEYPIIGLTIEEIETAPGFYGAWWCEEIIGIFAPGEAIHRADLADYVVPWLVNWGKEHPCGCPPSAYEPDLSARSPRDQVRWLATLALQRLSDGDLTECFACRKVAGVDDDWDDLIPDVPAATGSRTRPRGTSYTRGARGDVAVPAGAVREPVRAREGEAPF